MTPRAQLRRLLRLHPFAAALFALGLVATILFALRTVVFAVYWSDPAHRQAFPEPWMTPRYIALSWDIPPDEMARLVPVPEGLGHRPTLEAIAKARGIPVEQLIAQLTATLAARAATR